MKGRGDRPSVQREEDLGLVQVNRRVREPQAIDAERREQDREGQDDQLAIDRHRFLDEDRRDRRRDETREQQPAGARFLASDDVIDASDQKHGDGYHNQAALRDQVANGRASEHLRIPNAPQQEEDERDAKRHRRRDMRESDAIRA